jgi:hypothetical protein
VKSGIAAALRELGVGAAAKAGASGFGSLSRAGDYGVWAYKTLKPDLKGLGLEVHLLIEKRFAGVMGQNVGDMASIAVTDAEHQAFTNAWRTAIRYGPQGKGWPREWR